VLAGNFIGGGIGALVLSYGGVFTGDTVDAARYISEGGFSIGAVPLFFKAAMAGLIVAGVVWVGFASTDSVSRMLVVYLAFLAIPLGDLFHVVVSFTEVLYLFFEYNIPLYGAEISLYSGIVGFVIPVLIGEHHRRDRLGHAGELLPDQPGALRGGALRGSHPPAHGAGVGARSRRRALVRPDLGRHGGDAVRKRRLPDHGPHHEPADRRPYRRACESDRERPRGRTRPHRPRRAGARADVAVGGRRPDRRRLRGGMAGLRETAEEYDIDVSTSTVVSHRSFEEVFNMARRTRPDAVLMGWGEDQLWNAARAERPIDELTNQLPCDFLILNESDLDTSRVLLPTSGGPDSTLGAEVASVLSRTADAEVSLLHVVNGPENRTEGEGFLTAWAAENGLSDAERIVDDSGDVEGAIAREAADNTLVIIGATEKGLLSRLVSNSLHLDVIHDVDCSVLLAERRATARSGSALRSRTAGVRAAGRRRRARSGRGKRGEDWRFGPTEGRGVR